MIRIPIIYLCPGSYITRAFLILVAIAYASNPIMLFGSTYYVAKTGSNSHDCKQGQSASTPKLTIAAGLACMVGGDTLVIGSGIYNEYITYTQLLSGTSDSNRTIIRARPGDTVILRPTGGTPTWGDVIWVHGQSYITFDGLTLDARNATRMSFFGDDHRGIWSSFITVKNSFLINSTNSNCIAVQPGNNFQLINNVVHNCGVSNLTHGVYLRGSNHLIEGNKIFNAKGYGIHQWNSYSSNNDDNIIRYNHIHDNGDRGILIGSGKNNKAYGNTVRHNGKATGQGGVHVGYYRTDNNQVYDNIIHGNAGICVLIRATSTNTKVYNNVCSQNGTDAIIDQGIGSFIANND